jgi:hypothetical protein
MPLNTRSLKTSALLTTMLTAALPGVAIGATQVDSDSTTPLVTSAAGDITVTGETELDVDGADPITIDSNNSVTIEENSSVVADDADGRSGIAVQPGTTFNILIAAAPEDLNDDDDDEDDDGIDDDDEEAGAIEVLEDFVPEDEDGNGVADGPIASASNRYGIRVLPGAASSGSIVNNGTILVEGLSSRGISIESDFTGDLVNTGTIAVLGDYSVGIETASVDGDISLGGTVNVVGEGTQALVLGGDVSGTLRIDGTISKSTSFTDDDGNSLALSRSDLRVVAPTVSIKGDVAGGILLANRPYELDEDDDDEDNDGVDDAEEAIGTISSVGESPALVIGSADDIAIGGVEGRDGTFSLAVDGDIYASGYYSDFDATAVVIGGQGGSVDLVDGIGVSGSIRATTQDSMATALLIHEGANVPSLSNSGSILSSVSSSGEAEIWAVRDLSGTLTAIENSGHIQTTGSNEDLRTAIDLSANTTGVTIRQYLNEIDAASKAEEAEDEDYDPSNPSIYTSIIGDIVTGSGDDLLDVSSGTIDGDAYLGAGDDVVALSSDSAYEGDIHAGTGDFSMTVSDAAKYAGTIDPSGLATRLTVSDQAEVFATFENADQFNVVVEGGVLGAPQGETVSFGNLTVGSEGAIAVIVDGEEGTASSFDVGTATFAAGSSVQAEVTSLANAAGTYRVLTADTLTGAPELDLETLDLPLLFSGELTAGSNWLDLTIERKTAQELGLTQPQSAAYDAVIAATANSSTLEQSLLDVADVATLQGQIDSLLPDYAGGVFDLTTRATRLASKHVSDDSAIFYEDFPTQVWLEPIYFRGSKDAGETAAFKTDGKGITSGLESNFGFGYVGLSATYVDGKINNGDLRTFATEDEDTGDEEDEDEDEADTVTEYLQTIKGSMWQLGAHWRARSGPLYTFARASVSRVSLSSTRTFAGSVDDTDVFQETAGEWDGLAYAATAGASYGIDLGERFTLKPKAQVEYFRLREDAYAEDGAEAIDLTVEERTSDALMGTGSLIASYRFGDRRDTPLTVELEGGWRSVLGGTLGDTVAAFDAVDEDGDGEDDTEVGEYFTLAPDALEDGWFTEARVLLGGYGYTLQIGASAEQTQGGIDLSARTSFSVGF